jgi:hypothetical protein
VAPAPETPFENSHPTILNPTPKKTVSVEANNHHFTCRRFKRLCVVKVAGFDLAFPLILNRIVGYSIAADIKILSLITDKRARFY